MPALTDDRLFNGRLICRQHRNGYRFSIDAVLAAHFCTPAPGHHVLDLGCGCGIISLILAYLHPQVTVTGLEIQPELADLAGENTRANDFQDRLSVIQGDFCTVQKLIEPESFDLVVCNPPYREPGRGRMSRPGQRAGARHEIYATRDDVAGAASFAVKNRCRVVMVYPAGRLAAMISTLKDRRLEPKRLQPVYSYPGADAAELVLVEAVKNGGEGMRVMEPFYIYGGPGGGFSESMQGLYR